METKIHFDPDVQQSTGRKVRSRDAGECCGGYFEILGQTIHYPRSVYEVIPVCALFVAAVLVVYILVVPGQSRVLDAVLGQRNVIYQNGVPIDQQTYQFAFWTPSAETTVAMEEDVREGRVMAVDLAWQHFSGETMSEQRDEAEKRLKEFGVLLRGTGSLVNGYRRQEVRGHGRTDFKAGWWWTVSVSKEYNVEQFVDLYLNFWKPTKNGQPHNRVYVEILRWDYGYPSAENSRQR